MKNDSSETPSESHKPKIFKIALSILALAGLLLILSAARQLGGQICLSEINSQATAGMIFILGLLSGLHCVGMCGSFIIAYTAKDAELGRSVFHSHILYGAGKTLSYALFGALFGIIGSLFRITPLISGITICIAGIFLILYGLNMLGTFSVLKAIRIKQPEAMINYALEKRQQSRSPFIIGFFSGFLLGCGPLQVMYVLAAGNGNALEGAKFLALFGLGTLPALFGFGLLARLLSSNLTRRFVQASGIILIVMGSMMLNRGLIKTGSTDDFKSAQPACNCSR